MEEKRHMREAMERMNRARLPVIAASMMVGITGEALHWGFPASFGAMLASQFVLMLIALRP